MFLKIVFILANSADHDEGPLNLAFHLGLYSLSKFLLRNPECIQNEKG